MNNKFQKKAAQMKQVKKDQTNILNDSSARVMLNELREKHFPALTDSNIYRVALGLLFNVNVKNKAA